MSALISQDVFLTYLINWSVNCCVPSDANCLCFIPLQDSRRERSSNFQAFVKMALETLLGSCRRKHGGPRGRQGWEHLPLPPHFSPWTCRLGYHVAFHYRFCSALTEAECESDLHPSPSAVQPLFLDPPFPPSPTFFCPLTECSDADSRLNRTIALSIKRAGHPYAILC